MIIYLFTFSYNFIVHYIYKIKLGTIPILNETSNKRTNPNRLVTNTNNKIEERYAWNNDRFKYDRGRKNRNDFIIVVAIAGIFHGCIGGEIFPLCCFEPCRGHTRDEVMQNTPVDPFPPFSLPDSFSYFRGVHQPADFAGNPCTFHAVNSKI